MKKSLAGILAAVLLVTAGATSAFAEEWERGRGFVDADSDGICVFAGTERAPRTEFDEPNPISAYGKTKLEGEHFVRQFAEKFFILRTAWLYGDG